MQYLYSIDEKLMQVNRLMIFGKSVKAKRLLEEILTDEPDNALAHYELGRIYMIRLFDYEMAEYHLTLSMRFQPALIQPYYAQLQLYFRKGEYKKLIAMAKNAIEVNGIEKSTIYYYAALGCEQIMKLKRSIRYFEKAIQYAYDDSDTDQFNKCLARVNKKIEKRKKPKGKKATKMSN